MSKGRVVAAIVTVLVIGGAVAAFALSETRATEVQVAEVTREDLSVTVSASGKVEANTRIDVYPPTAGTLTSIEVTEGQQVRAGMVLARMDTAPIEVQVAQAEAAYAGALAQRDAITKSAPGAGDRQAAQAAVDAAWSAYSMANARYDAAKAGLGAPSASDIAEAQTAVALAQGSADAAKAAYDSFYNNVYLPAAEPRAAELEATLAALSLARDQAAANLATAKQGLTALLATADNTAATAAAKLGRDQAYAAYLGAVSQRDALTKASGVSAALASANAAVAAAGAARNLANDVLDRATIVAPADGIVLFNSSAGSLLGASGLGAGSGGALAVGSSVSPAAAPFSIVSFDTLAFTAQVDEADIVRVKPGMKTMISLDSLMDTEFMAEVERVGTEAVLTPTGGTAFPVLIRFEAKGQPVLLGMNGSVEIGVETIGQAITMPVEALLEEGDANYVYIVQGGKAKRTEITIGRLTDTHVEVLSGLAEGDEVIVSGVSDLSDGTRVRAE